MDRKNEKEQFFICKWCGKQTTSAGTRECDKCWELRHRIQMNLGLVRKIINTLEEEKWAKWKKKSSFLCTKDCYHNLVKGQKVFTEGQEYHSTYSEIDLMGNHCVLDDEGLKHWIGEKGDSFFEEHFEEKEKEK